MNKKINTLQRDNDRLIGEKLRLEAKIKVLEQPKPVKEKKLIKLGEGRRAVNDSQERISKSEQPGVRVSLKQRKRG